MMDTAKMKEQVLSWLEQFKFPGPAGRLSWEDCILEYPAQHEEKESLSGRRLRITVNLFTAANQYIISIIECLAPNVRGTYIITVHVNWTKRERQVQQTIDESYKGSFDNGLKARHIIWIQSFGEKQLFSALDACAVAIFGHELTPSVESDKPQGHPVKLPAGLALSIPETPE